MIEKFSRYISETEISITSWMLSFTGIILIRFLFESMASATNTGIVASDTYTLMHTWMFFIATALGISYIIGIFTGKYVDALKATLFGLPLIWLGPLIDMVISGGKGYRIAYISDTGMNIVRDALTFFGPNLVTGATMGLRIEMALIFLGLGVYVYSSSRSWVRAIVSSALSYVFVFILFSIPGLIYTAGHIQNPYGTNEQIVNYLSRIMLQSNLSHNTFRDALAFVSLGRLSEMAFDKLLSQIYFFLSCMLASVIFYKIDKDKFVAAIKNSRPERIVFFSLLLAVGMGAAYLYGYGRVSSLVDMLSMVILLIAWSSAWVYAVHINDIHDVHIDAISHSGRPIVQNTVTIEETRQQSVIFLLSAVIGGWAASFTTQYFAIMFMITSYIYSVPPLRLKKYPLISPFLISIACLLSVLAGFFFISFDKRVQTFPAFIALGIMLIFTLIINIKDLEDSEGDAADNIYTLPVIFKHHGKKVVGSCFSLGILLIPYFLSMPLLFITAIPTAIAGYLIIQSSPRPQRKIFLLGFLFFAVNVMIFAGILFLIAK